jgi:hypothetical protein
MKSRMVLAHKAVCVCACLLLQDLVQSCLRGEGGCVFICVCVLFLQDLLQSCSLLQYLLQGGGYMCVFYVLRVCYERRQLGKVLKAVSRMRSVLVTLDFGVRSRLLLLRLALGVSATHNASLSSKQP